MLLGRVVLSIVGLRIAAREEGVTVMDIPVILAKKNLTFEQLIIAGIRKAFVKISFLI